MELGVKRSTRARAPSCTSNNSLTSLASCNATPHCMRTRFATTNFDVCIGWQRAISMPTFASSVQYILFATCSSAAASVCGLDNWSAVFSDMHDGDSKTLRLLSGRIIITPFGNAETWRVDATVDEASCSAMIDFNVVGKPNPPPCTLNLTLYTATTLKSAPKIVGVFTDPTNACDLGDPGSPLNAWIETASKPSDVAAPSAARSTAFTCPSDGNLTFGDMHDGDAKSIALVANAVGAAATIRPAFNSETWEIDAMVSATNCSAMVDFDVPGKPNPPPCALAATAWALENERGGAKIMWEFTDVLGCIVKTNTTALNAWVQQ